MKMSTVFCVNWLTELFQSTCMNIDCFEREMHDSTRQKHMLSGNITVHIDNLSETHYKS